MKPVSRTAFYCTGVRALDARRATAACADQYAERFMEHRIIDDLLRDRLADHNDLRIVIIGAGFDYLGETRSRELLQTLREVYPQGEVICDVVTQDLFAKFAQPIHKRLVELGASFALPERPLGCNGDWHRDTRNHGRFCVRP